MAEQFFEECAVTAINPRHVELAVLSGINMPERSRDSVALNALDLPVTAAECTFELLHGAEQEEAGQFPARYIPVSDLNPDDMSRLEAGRVVHWHQGSERGQLCISPRSLSSEQIKLAIDAAFQERDTALRQHIADMQETAFYERTKLEYLQPGEPFYLFKGAEIRQYTDGGEYLYVPPRILISERWGPRRISVEAGIADLADDRRDPLSEKVFTNGGHSYRIEARQPYGDIRQETDPAKRKVVHIEVLTSAPLGHETAHEEQKLEVRVNGIGYWAELDSEHLMVVNLTPDYDTAYPMDMLGEDDLNRHMQAIETGRQNIQYIHFHQVGESEPNVVDVTDGEDNPKPINNSFRAHLIVPLDLALLGEIEAEFPGM